MGFVRTLQDIIAMRKESFDFYGAEMFSVFWETREDIIAGLIPKPLKPAKSPLVTAFTANYPSTNFSEPYSESALFIQADFNGEEGLYCLAMPVTDDMAMAGGREYFGYPKKIAKIEMKRNGETAYGWTERHGIRFMEIKAKFNGKLNDPASLEKIMGIFNNRNEERSLLIYNFKFFPNPDRTGFDYNPRLVKEEVVFRSKTIDIGEAEIVINRSDFDPWYELKVVKMLGAVYTVGDNSMLSGSVVAEADPMEFLPYAYLKSDIH